MDEIKIKEAFSKIKEEMSSLTHQISELSNGLLETNALMKQLNEEIIQLKLERIAGKPYQETPTHPTQIPTHPATPLETPTHPLEIEGLKEGISGIPIGNEGVPTDRQTNQQTNQQILRQIISREIPPRNSSFVVTKFINNVSEPISVVTKEKPIQQQIKEASEILNSLDLIKKDLRRKFKKITKQEMLVFSTIYALEEQEKEVDYQKVANKLGLSQSSIRDYVQKIALKGIPIVKEKLNNKKILLHISRELKEIAPLSAIIQLREL